MLGSARKRQSTLPPWRIGAKTISFVALFLLTLYCASKITQFYQFPITQVKVFGMNHVDHQEVQQLVTPLVSQGFFATEVGLIKDRLSQLPWVASVSVRRVWPDEVVVMVTEKTAVARWNENALLSSTGEVFSPSSDSYPSGLPVFVGPEGQQIYILQFYAKINRLLAPLHFRIARLELTPYSSWNIAFDNGMKLAAGHKDILTRMSHFVKVYPKIIGQHSAEDVDYIDLRYANGLAVKWKTVT
jgi:cell division protein FtsQ